MLMLWLPYDTLYLLYLSLAEKCGQIDGSQRSAGPRGQNSHIYTIHSDSTFQYSYHNTFLQCVVIALHDSMLIGNWKLLLAEEHKNLKTKNPNVGITGKPRIFYEKHFFIPFTN